MISFLSSSVPRALFIHFIILYPFPECKSSATFFHEFSKEFAKSLRSPELLPHSPGKEKYRRLGRAPKRRFPGTVPGRQKKKEGPRAEAGDPPGNFKQDQ